MTRVGPSSLGSGFGPCSGWTSMGTWGPAGGDGGPIDVVDEHDGAQAPG